MLKYFIACKNARLIWVKKAQNGAMCLEQVQRFIKRKNILGLDALKIDQFCRPSPYCIFKTCSAFSPSTCANE